MIALPPQAPRLHDVDAKVQANIDWLWIQLKQYLSIQRQVLSISGPTTLTNDYADAILECTGTNTQTLPAAGQAGQRFYFFNSGTGVITIAGTINGNAAGYKLVNQYQYVEITSDGTQWLVTSNN